jgi:hypothetical protein
MKLSTMIKTVRKTLSIKLAYNARDIHAVSVGVSMVIVTTVIDFVSKHVLDVKSGGAGTLALILLMTLTSRSIGVILRHMLVNLDKPLPEKKDEEEESKEEE